MENRRHSFPRLENSNAVTERRLTFYYQSDDYLWWELRALLPHVCDHERRANVSAADPTREFSNYTRALRSVTARYRASKVLINGKSATPCTRPLRLRATEKEILSNRAHTYERICARALALRGKKPVKWNKIVKGGWTANTLRRQVKWNDMLSPRARFVRNTRRAFLNSFTRPCEMNRTCELSYAHTRASKCVHAVHRAIHFFHPGDFRSPIVNYHRCLTQ